MNIFLFKNNEDLTLTTRPHKFNAEALDGDITFIEDGTSALVIGHLPTKRFTYEYWIVEGLPARLALEKVEQLGPEKKEGRPYYRAICKEDLDEYTSLLNLKERNTNKKETVQRLSKAKKVKKPNQSLDRDIISVSSSKKMEDKKDSKIATSPQNIISNTKMYRTSEKSLK